MKGDFYGKTTPLKAIEGESLWDRNLNALAKVIVYGKGDSLWEKMIILQRAALLVIISGDQLSRERIWPAIPAL